VYRIFLYLSAGLNCAESTSIKYNFVDVFADRLLETAGYWTGKWDLPWMLWLA